MSISSASLNLRRTSVQIILSSIPASVKINPIITESETINFVDTILGTLPPHKTSVEISSDWESFEEAYWSTDLIHVDCAMFGKSRAWGAICFWDEITLLGGDKRFMEVFLKASGGEQELKDRFQIFVDEGLDLREEGMKKMLKRLGWSLSD